MSAAPDTSAPTHLPLSAVRVDPALQMRECLDLDAVADYRADMERGKRLPAVLVYDDGTDLWLVDGFHRFEAASAAGLDRIEVEVERGTREQAIWRACTVNLKNGKRPTSADKRIAIRAALRLRPELADSMIAEHCGSTGKTVATIRAELESTWEIPKLDHRVGRDGKVRNVAGIGPKAPDGAGEEAPEPTPPAPEALGGETADTLDLPPDDPAHAAPPRSTPEPAPPAPSSTVTALVRIAAEQLADAGATTRRTALATLGLRRRVEAEAGPVSAATWTMVLHMGERECRWASDGDGLVWLPDEDLPEPGADLDLDVEDEEEEEETAPYTAVTEATPPPTTVRRRPAPEPPPAMPPEPEPLPPSTIDAASLLAPEPPPVASEDSRSVTDLAIESARLLKLSPDTIALLLARREQGRERYGTELQTHNGRRALVDMLQEAVDGLVYALQYLGEHPEEPARSVALDLIFLQRRTLEAVQRAVQGVP